MQRFMLRVNYRNFTTFRNRLGHGRLSSIYVARILDRSYILSIDTLIVSGQSEPRTPGMENVLITGNTYPVKDSIKALGGRWDAAAKGWRVPVVNADKARALVTSAPRSTFSRSSSSSGGARRSSGTWTGCSCGSVDEYTKASDCWTCKHDAS